MPIRVLLPAAIVAALLATPAAGAPLYRVTLAAPAQQNMIVKDIRWVCAGTACAAPRTASTSDAGVCSAVVRKLGRIERFEAADRIFDAAQLDRCNAAAR